jgi:hypothetical protein
MYSCKCDKPVDCIKYANIFRLMFPSLLVALNLAALSRLDIYTLSLLLCQPIINFLI